MIAAVRRTNGPRCDAAPLRAAIVAACVLGALAACLPAPAAAATTRTSALPAFSSCASLLGYAQRNARRTGGVTGVPTRAGTLAPQVLVSPRPAVATG